MRLVLNTAQEKYLIEVNDLKLSLFELCNLNRLPINSMSFFAVGASNKVEKIIGVFNPLESFSTKGINEIIIQPNRNIDYSHLINKKRKVRKVENPTAEYFLSNPIDLTIHNCFEFAVEDCKDFIFTEVNAFFKKVELNKERKIVVGISGGGDSNTLLESILATGKVSPKQLIAVMCLGIPSWDLGKDRAIKICKKSNVELVFLSPAEISNIIGKRGSIDFTEGFNEAFNEEEANEILGTLIVRLGLFRVAKELNAQSVVLGINLEDILAESLLFVMKGRLPLPFPIRIIDNTPIWFPLYKIPKNILDGRFPKYSYENYNQRIQDKLIGRAIPYYLAQYLNGLIPGVEFDLLSGFQALSELNKNCFNFDEDLGFSISEPINQDLKNRWKYFTQ